MSSDIAVDVPLVAGVHAALKAGLARRSAMITNHARDKKTPKLSRHGIESPTEHVGKVFDGFLGSSVVGDLEFLMDIPCDHVAAEADDGAGIADGRAAHMVPR